MGGLEVVDERYAAVFERARTVLEPDPRVASVEVQGSVGAGTADEWSDLDLQIVATEEGFEDLVADWPRWLAEITPTVFARTPIAPFVVNSVTNDGLTLDLVISKGAPFVIPTPTDYAVGLLAGTRFAELGSALDYAVAEQLRGLAGLFVPAVRYA